MRQKKLGCFLFFALVFLTACRDEVHPVDAGVSQQLAQNRAGLLSNLNYRLRFDIPADPEADIDAHVVVTFDLTHNSVPLQLDFRAGGENIKKVSSNGADTLEYEAPKLTTHDDMSDLLALDPPMPGAQPISWDDSQD